MKLIAYTLAALSLSLLSIHAEELAGDTHQDNASTTAPSQTATEVAPKPLPKFEYLVRFIEYGRKQQDVLNALGKDGWELVAVNPLREGAKAHPFYFKRPLRSVKSAKHRAEQVGADQPATAPESKSEGRDKPKPESEGRSQ